MTKIEKGRPIRPEDSYRIMIVDGQHRHMIDMKEALKRAGQEIVAVGSVPQAKAFLESKDHVDVIISETFLENDSVFELLQLVKRDPQHTDVPVLLIADEPSQVGESCMDSVTTAADILGAHKVIHMPVFDLPLLMRETKAILATRDLPKKEDNSEGAY